MIAPQGGADSKIAIHAFGVAIYIGLLSSTCYVQQIVDLRGTYPSSLLSYSKRPALDSERHVLDSERPALDSERPALDSQCPALDSQRPG